MNMGMWNDGVQFVAQNLFNFLLQSTIVILVGGLVASAFRNSAVARSAIYRATLVVVVLCPVLSLAIDQAGWGGWGVEIPSLPRAVEITQLDRTVDEAGAKVTTPSATNEMALESPVGTPNTQVDAPVAGPVPGPLFEPQVRNVLTHPPKENFDSENAFVYGYLYLVVAILWFAGFTRMGISLYLSYIRANQFLTGSLPASDEVVQLCKAWAKELQVSVPDVRQSPAISSPCLIGYWRPVILIPSGHSSQEDLRNAFVHELAHLYRRDNYWRLFHRLASCFFFFQPLLRRIGYLLDLSAEEVCDDFVIAHCKNRAAYAHQLLAVVESNFASRGLAVPMVNLRGSVLRHRVTRILDQSRDLSIHISVMRKWVICSGAFLFLIVVSQLGSPLGAALQSEVQTTRAGSDSPNLEFTGVVLDDKGQPIEDAQVVAYPTQVPETYWKAPEIYAQTRSSNKGEFRIEIDSSNLVAGRYCKPEENITLVVMKNGHQMQWFSHQIPGQTNSQFKPNEHLKVVMGSDAHPLELTLVDEWGKPLEGVSVKISDVMEFPHGRIDEIIVAYQNGDISSASATDGWTDWAIGHPFLEWKTDDAGRVEIPGIGRSRRVNVDISGPGVCYDSFGVLMQPSDPLLLLNGRSTRIRYYGLGARIVCKARFCLMNA